MILTENDLKYLQSIGFKDNELDKIKEATEKSIYTICYTERKDNSLKNITAEDARELLGDEKFLSGIAHSTFHCMTTEIIPKTFKIYTIYFNSCMLFGHNNITFKDCKPLPITLKAIKHMQKFPHIYATNIKYKIHEHAINPYTPSFIEIPFEIWREFDINSDYNYRKAASDFISDVTNEIHTDFNIDCNLTIDELNTFKTQHNVITNEYSTNLIDSINTLIEILQIEVNK